MKTIHGVNNQKEWGNYLGRLSSGPPVHHDARFHFDTGFIHALARTGEGHKKLTTDNYGKKQKGNFKHYLAGYDAAVNRSSVSHRSNLHSAFHSGKGGR